MSRLGKIPVPIPKTVKMFTESGLVRLEGAKGKLSLPVPRGIKIESKDDKIIITRSDDSQQSKANHGTTRAHLVNMVEGVTLGHKKDLEIQGVGFRAQLQGKKIILNLGFSHPVEFPVPDDVKISVPTQTEIKVEGADKCRVGHIAASIRELKPAEPYKGKGIRYVGEFVRRKQGKSVTK